MSQQHPVQYKASNFTNVIFYMICAFVAAALIWSFQAELDQVVRADAKLEPTGKVQVVQNRYPGSIQRFNLQVGDKVSKDQVLFWLEQDDVLSSIQQNRIEYFTAIAEVARYQAEAQASQPQFVADLPESYALQQIQIYNAKRKALVEQLAIIDQQMDSKNNAIEQSISVAKAAQQGLSLTLEELAIFEPLVKAAVEPKIKLINLRRQQQEAKDSIAQQKLVRQGLLIDINGLIKQQRQIKEEFQAQAQERLADSQKRADKATAEHLALTEKLAMAEVKAPIDGIVTAIHVTTEGAVVNGGEVLAEIVPQTDRFKVLARLQPQDISEVSIGQECKVSFINYDFAKYGSIAGKITTIAQNITETQQGDMYYEVWVETTSSTFSKSDITPNLIPGMVAQVDILGDKTRVVDYILNPLNRTAARALTEL